jgi:hypothetical protein
MMVLSALRPDASLLEFLESRARAASVRRLGVEAIAALVIVTGGFGAFPFARPVVVTLAGAFLCYAAWGLVDRARSHSAIRGWGRTAQCLRVLCGLLVGLGVLSGVGSILAIWFIVLGDAWVL